LDRSLSGRRRRKGKGRGGIRGGLGVAREEARDGGLGMGSGGGGRRRGRGKRRRGGGRRGLGEDPIGGGVGGVASGGGECFGGEVAGKTHAEELLHDDQAPKIEQGRGKLRPTLCSIVQTRVHRIRILCIEFLYVN
jgi:hypothetical protein